MPLHSARLQWHGWAAPDVGVNADGDCSARQEPGPPQSLLIGLWGMWVSTLTQGRVAEAPAWAQRLLDEGSKRGDIDMQILGHRGRMSSDFYLGELRKADDHGKKALRLYDPSRAGHWIELVGNDVRTAVGVCTSQAIWMLGTRTAPLQRERSEGRTFATIGASIRYRLGVDLGCVRLDYRREPERLLAHANEAERLAREQSIPVLYKRWCRSARGLRSCAWANWPKRLRYCAGARAHGTPPAVISMFPT